MDIKNTLHTFFEEQVKNAPDRVAAKFGKKSLSYSDLNNKANQLAHYLQKKGIKPDTPVAICLERSFDFLVAQLAILKAGGSYLPLDAAQPETRLQFLLEDSKAPVLLTKSTLKNKFIAYQGSLILLDKDEKNINKEALHNPDSEVDENHLAYIIYTSGSTGMPKGVLIEHHSVINYCQWFAEYTLSHSQQRIDFSSNPVFDMAVTVSVIPLMLGLTVVICDDEIKKNPGHYIQHLVSSRINTIKLTPSYFKVLLQEVKNNHRPLPHLKSIILGGENLSAAECRSWLKLYPKHNLFNEYGPTETTVAASAYKVNSANIVEQEDNIPIGIAGNNMSYLIMDAQHIPVPDGQTGELFIGGDSLARGYLNQPELTEQRFIKDSNNKRLYKTGDLCRKRTDGMIEYFGRMDDQVKIRGFRIEPGEIEKQLTSYPNIAEAIVLAQKDALNEQRLVAYYLLKTPKTELDNTQIRNYLLQYLPSYMVPTAFLRVDSFPLTANGKLDKAALPVPKLISSQNYRTPSTALEKKLAKIWAKELGVDCIGLDDDFFELGGHSLSAARIISQISNELKKNITLYDFYKAARIAKLVPVIKKTKKINHLKPTFNKKEFSTIKEMPLSEFQFLMWMSNLFEPRIKKLNIVARKRMQGALNKAALELAFQAVLKKHEVLIYRVLKFQPTQLIQKNLSFKLLEKNITSLSDEQSELELEQSLTELNKFHPWPKNAPLLIARLFYLNHDAIELQICMPHLISDNDSVDILFADLSQFYLLYSDKLKIDTIETDSNYKEYVFNDQHALETYLDKDIIFWEQYLKDTSLFTFPEQQIVRNMKEERLPYSTYIEVPDYSLKNLRRFCEQKHISINNGLSAILALALRNCCGDIKSKTPYTLINIVKSTRDNPMYDHTIGCFLRVEPIKIDLNKGATVTALS